MCGITGYFSLDNSFKANVFSSANNSIRHRGPDDAGYVVFDRSFRNSEYHDENLADFNSSEPILGAFGFRRLAIIDLSDAGHQPMRDSTGNYWIVFNGEVYNYLEIRRELEQFGYQFRSNCDTEVVLYAYIHWGADCLNHFNGMWALSILDNVKKTLFCARDRFGIKPFNYFYDGEKFVFASEVKQICEMVPSTNSVNNSILFDFLAFGVKNHTNQTFYSNIFELRGGECLTIDLGQKDKFSLQKSTWWDLQYDRTDGNESELVEQLLALLTDSTNLRLRSDVPIGTALSGGLDSTGLVSIIDQLTDTRQNVFTVSSSDKNTDELAFAQQTINKYGLNSFKVEFGRQNIDLLEKITHHHDQPLSSAGNFGGWVLQKLIKESGITVNLNGQGADELMGGYSRPPHALRYLNSIMQGKVIDAHKQLYKGISNSNKSLLPTLGVFSSDTARFALRQFAYRAVLRKRKHLFNKEWYDEHSQDSPFLNDMGSKGIAGPLQKKESYRELKSTMIPSLLHNVDRDSTAHSLEARVPFLDYRVAELVFNIPPEQLTKNGYTKYLYRKAMIGKIPEELLWNNNKKGFDTPVNIYLDIGSDYFRDQIGMIPNDHALSKSALMDFSKQWKCTDYPLYWRALCTVLWSNKNDLSC